MKQNKVVISNGCPIFIGENIYEDINSFLGKSKFQNSKFFIIIDENTFKYCLPELTYNVKILKHAEIIKTEAGEENKTIQSCIKLWKSLSKLQAKRNSIIINLGGGVISDKGGFVASTFKRGIRFINIPTTLLSQIDAAIGGKSGVNLDNLKNQIGVFSMPEAVFINTNFLKTLPVNQLLSGFAEIIKYSLISDKHFWEILKAKSFEKIKTNNNLNDFIIRSIEIKNKIIKADPKEKGIRKILNFGHTFGHAFETFSLINDEKSLLHGEAVAMGMVCESILSHKYAGLSEDELNEIISFIFSNFNYYFIKTDDFDNIFEIMTQDKKNTDRTINFTLISSIGYPLIDQKFNKNIIIEILKYYSHLKNKL